MTQSQPAAARSRAMARGGQPQRPTAAQRAAQSARDRQLHAQATAASQGNRRAMPKARARNQQPSSGRQVQGPRNLGLNQFAPRGLGYYDAFANAPSDAIVSTSIGPSTQVTGMSVDTVPGQTALTGNITTWTGTTNATSLVQSVTSSRTLILFNPGASDSAVAHIMCLKLGTGTQAGELVVDVKEVHCSQFTDFGPAQSNSSSASWLGLAHADGNSTTVDGRVTRRIANLPLRGSVRIRNVTEAYNVGGTVRFMRLNAGVILAGDPANSTEDAPHRSGLPPSPAMFLAFCEMVKDSPKTRTMTGHDLREGHQMNTYPVDFMKAMSFEQDTTFGEALMRPAFSTAAILIDDFTPSGTSGSKNNSYEISCAVHRAARFDPSSILGGLMKTLMVSSDHAAKAAMREEAAEPAKKHATTTAHKPPQFGFTA